MDNSIQPPQPPQLNTKKGKLAQFFGELSKSRKTALIVVVLIATLGAGWLVFSKAETPSPIAPPAPLTRNIPEQPFSKWSPWNMPIGSNATFADNKLPETGGTIDTGNWSVALYVAKDTDPLATVNTVENGSVQLKIPNGAVSTGDEDGSVSIIQPDGLTAYEFYDFKGSGTTYTAQLFSKVDLAGTGVATGYPRAAQTSATAGLIREKEWNDGKISHALALSIPRSSLLRYKPDSNPPELAFIWPAETQDGGDEDYTGSVPMGSLVAIPSSVDINSLGLSKDGLMVAKALQDYGGYIVDSSDSGGPKAWAVPALEGAVDQAKNEMPKINEQLRIVKNSSPNSIGGGGNPRICYSIPVGNDNSTPNPNGNVTQPAGCENSNPPPVEPCPASQVLINGECSTCPSDTTIKDGKCVNPECSPAEDGSPCAPKCPTGKVLINNVCSTCPSDTYFVNGECKTPDCPVPVNGSSPSNGSAPLCEDNCPEGQIKVGGKCVSKEGDCPTDTILKNGECVGNCAFTPDGCIITAGEYDDDVAAYSSGWEVGQDENNYGYYKGSDHYTNKANETMNLKFKGVNVKIYGINSSNMGTATVAIDGGNATTINYYGATKKGNQLVYDSGTLADGNHTLVLKSTGQSKKVASVITASYNGNRQLATGNNEPETGTYVSIDRIVVTGAIDIEGRCPEGQVRVDGKCVTPEPGDDCPNGQVKVDGKCVTPEITCPVGQSVVNGACKDDGGKGGSPEQPKIDSDITKKPEAKTMAEKLVNTGRFLLLPAIVAVAIILIASGLYLVTKKKKQ